MRLMKSYCRDQRAVLYPFLDLSSIGLFEFRAWDRARLALPPRFLLVNGQYQRAHLSIQQQLPPRGGSWPGAVRRGQSLIGSCRAKIYRYGDAW